MNNQFDQETFIMNIDEAAKYIKVNKALNIHCRFRMETNSIKETVKVYTVLNGIIIKRARFENGRLVFEEKAEI